MTSQSVPSPFSNGPVSSNQATFSAGVCRLCANLMGVRPQGYSASKIGAEYLSRIDISPFYIVIACDGLDAVQMTELRKRLHKIGAEVLLVKNSIFRVAAREAEVPALGASFVGKISIVTGRKDICTAVKALLTFISEFDALRIQFGFFRGARLNASEIIALATLPPIEVLRKKLLGLLLLPAAKLIATLETPASQLLTCLNSRTVGIAFNGALSESTNRSVVAHVPSVLATDSDKNSQALHFSTDLLEAIDEEGRRVFNYARLDIPIDNAHSIILKKPISFTLNNGAGTLAAVEWGIVVNVENLSQLPRTIARRFLLLLEAASNDSLTIEQQECWGKICEAVDFKRFTIDRSPARYMEGLLCAHQPETLVEWHDGTRETLKSAAGWPLAIVNAGERFSAYVKLGSDNEAVAIDRVAIMSIDESEEWNSWPTQK